jgi:methoxymalonate biosynthesis acyl carrier protein
VTTSETTDPVVTDLLAFLTRLTSTEHAPDEDLFAAGGLSSLMALELVTHVEQQYGIAVTGDDLSLDNFRTAEAMARLGRRLGTG